MNAEQIHLVNSLLLALVGGLVIGYILGTVHGVRYRKVDVQNLLAELRALEEITGEHLEPDDEAVVQEIERRYV